MTTDEPITPPTFVRVPVTQEDCRLMAFSRIVGSLIEWDTPSAIVPPRVRDAETLWPPLGTPGANLNAQGMTEARCVVQFYYGRTIDEKLDALHHLASICTLKAGTRFWSPKPGVRFVGASTAKQDWENCDPNLPFLQRVATRGWFTIHLPAQIEKYAPQYITKRELLELARMRDKDLLHVCSAVVHDMFDASEYARRHELRCSTITEADEEKRAPEPAFAPDYAGAVHALVTDRDLRAALTPRVARTLELVLRRLAAGVDAENVIASVARDIHRDERTVTRHLAKSKVASGASMVGKVLAGFLLPDETTVSKYVN